MILNALEKGYFISRYKRFFSEIQLVNCKEAIVAHCANTGSMTGLLNQHANVWLTRNHNLKCKLRWRWELVELASFNPPALAMINTLRANTLVAEALENHWLADIGAYQKIKREVKVDQCRLDFCLEHENGKKIYLEVKQVTLADHAGNGYFPDAKSSRALKHLRTLQSLAENGNTAVLLFCVTHTAIKTVSPALEIDPVYSQALVEAAQKGVKILAYRCAILIHEKDQSADIRLQEAISVKLPTFAKA